MQCVVFDAPGEPADVLQCRQGQVPVPDSGQVLVRMTASPVNPSDLTFIRGVYGIAPQYPQVPGFEGVGVVEASGGGLRGRLFRGRRVVVMNPSGGNWAEYAVVPETRVIPVSSVLSDEQAATFFVNPATAWILTREVLRIPQGQWLLQTAAGSALGHMIVRLGRHCGFRTLCIVRREESVESLRQAGADAVVVFDPDHADAAELREQVLAAVGEDGVRYAIDPVSGRTAAAVIECLGSGARMLLFGSLSNEPIPLVSRQLMQKDASVSGFWLGNYMMHRSLLFRLRLVRRLTGLIRDGVLHTDIARTYALTEVTSAVRAAEDSAVTGKVLLSCR